MSYAENNMTTPLGEPPESSKLSPREASALSDELHKKFLAGKYLQEINRVLSGELTPEQLAEQQAGREIALEQRADHDGLTGLLNYQGFTDELTETLKIIQQHDIPSYLYFLDIDKLREFNKRWGKMPGNLLIQTYANVLKEKTSKLEHLSSFVGRFGGDEYVILLIGASRTEASILAEDIRRTIPEAVKETFSNPTLEETVSIGIAKIQPDDTTRTLFERGDTFLDQAKVLRNHFIME